MNNLGSATIKVSICGIFAEPTFKSEMVNQALKSDKVQIVNKKGDWYQVCLEYDGYRGWIHEMYFNEPLDFNKSFTQDMFLEFPIIQTAFRMIGKPYVWGGRSAHGYDCSGLIQTTMSLLGYNFPRDAKDQVNSKLLYEIKLKDALEEDIVFFEENEVVTHVGILISAAESFESCSKSKFFIIHSSGMVKISEVEINNYLYCSIDQSDCRKNKLHKIMRLKKNNA